MLIISVIFLLMENKLDISGLLAHAFSKFKGRRRFSAGADKNQTMLCEELISGSIYLSSRALLRCSYAEFTLHDFPSHRITAVFTLHDGPVFCRFVLPCQILLPPFKTVGSTIRQRKILPVKQ